MDDPVPPPDFLAAVHAGAPPTPALAAHDAVHAFDLASQTVPGLPGFRDVCVLPELLSPGEAAGLLEEIERAPWRGAQSGKQKQHYGPRVNFNRRRMNAARFGGLPAYARRLEASVRRRVAEGEDLSADARRRLGAALEGFETTDAFVLRYEPARASNLDFHVDDVFAYGDTILDVSLESDAVLTFLYGRPGGEAARPARRDTGDEAPAPLTTVRVPLPARSVAIVFGGARHHWEHAVLAGDVRGQRTSVTLRTLSTTLRATPEGRSVLARARGGAADQSPLPTTASSPSRSKTS